MRPVAPLLALSLVAAASLARAHARPAVFNALRVDRRDPLHVVAQATWGFAVTRDGGRSWRWACAAVLGVDPRFEDPRVLLGYEGRVLASTFDGVFASDPAGCDWGFASDALTDRWVIDLAADPREPTRLFAVATDVGAEDQVFRSLDEGRTWEAWGPPQDDVLLDTLLVAPSRPERLYLSADIPGLPEDRTTMVLRSDDGGASWERLPFEGLGTDERFLRIRAVSPADPDVVFAVVLAASGAVLDAHRLVRSEDGGATFATVLEASQLGDVVIAEDGGTVWTASRAGGVYRSDDAGLTFSRVQADLPVSCLTWTDGELRACTVQRLAGFALARSADRGATWEPLLRLEEIDAMVECPRCSDVGIACPPWLPDVSYDLGFDAGIEIDLEPDGGIGLPRDAAVPFECGGPPPPPEGCACRVVRPRGGGGLGIGVVFVLGLVVRARLGS